MRHADRPSTQVQVHVDAPATVIWPLISDISFPVGQSAELLSVEWEADGGTAPAVGRRFVGTNANRHFGQWQTTATITECDEPRTFAWVVGELDDPNTSWRFTLTGSGPGTDVVQWFQLGYGPSGLHLAIGSMPDKEEAIVARRVEDMRAAMKANLEAVKQAVEGR